MSRVDFYVVASGGSLGAATVACRVVEKAWRQGLGVYVHVPGETEARRLDELLWTFREESFVPHGLAAGDGAGEAVSIGWDLREGAGRAVLVNLGAPLTVEQADFERIAEVVSDDPDDRAAARQRFAAYRGLGHELRHHEVQP